jgi:hypothetical protein
VSRDQNRKIEQRQYQPLLSSAPRLSPGEITSLDG